LELQTAGVTKLTVDSSGVTLATPLPVASGGTGSTSAAFVDLASNVTGTLPIANGGTGTTSTTFANLVTNVTGTLPIANGGTNSTATATAGGIGYGTGTAHAYTSAGTSGQVLTSAGSGAPSWQAPASGALVLLATATASGAAYVTFDGYFSSTYTHYFFLFNNLLNTSGAQPLRMQLKVASSYVVTSNYQANWIGFGGTSNSVTSNTTSGVTSFQLGLNSIGLAGSFSTASGYLYLHNVLSTSKQKVIQGVFSDVTGYVSYRVSGNTTGTEFNPAVTGARFFPSSGTISAGTISLYGIAK